MRPTLLALLVTLGLGCSSTPSVTPDAGGGGGTDAPISPEVDGGGTLETDAGGTIGTDAGGTTTAGDPSMVGPYTVTRTSTMVTGATYVSFVPAIPAGTRAPLVLFKHGFQLSTANYATTAERIASHGFVVVGIDTGGGLTGGPTNVQERDATIAAIAWATGTAPFSAQVDGDLIAVMGHSRGGKVAVMVAAAEPRIDAALLLDPVNGCGPGMGFSTSCPDVTGPAYAGALTMPVGVMGETNNATGGFMPCAPAAQNYSTIYDAIPAATWATEWTYTGADHMDFTDDGGGFAGSFCADGPGDDATIRAQVRTMAVAFLRRHLRGETAMDPYLVGASVPSDVTTVGP